MYVVRRDPEKGYLDTWFWVPKTKINVDGAKAALTFQFFEERRPKFLFLYRETPDHLLVPREFWDPKDCEFTTIDCRPRSYPKVEIGSRITLDLKDPTKTTQVDALQALLAARGGILQLGCGKGKTVIALELCARAGVPVLIVVDNTQLLSQWQEAIAQFLIVPEGIGLIQGDSFDWDKPVVIATYTSLANRAATMPENIRRRFGLIIWDEAHHMAAPTWARSADLFHGKRLALTATPERTDGYHVIYDFHVGRVIYKDLTQDLKPDFYFLWTGFKLNLEDAATRARVLDVQGELHISKVATYFSTWKERLDLVIREAQTAEAAGRRVLVLSKSVDELINLLALWNGKTDLYTDVPWPTMQDVGAKVPPEELSPVALKKHLQSLAITKSKLAKGVNPTYRSVLEDQKKGLLNRLEQHDVYKKVVALREKRQRAYLKDLLAMPSTAGLMIRKVAPKERTAMLRTKQVMFAIAKYGREGLDEDRLDTIIASFPVSDRNALQQLMGRIQRKKAGKKRCVVIVFEDDIAILRGMCRNIRRHLREWPKEDGGPYSYTNIGKPPIQEPDEWNGQTLRVPAKS